MKLTIKNISSIKRIINHNYISINDVDVEPDVYTIFFYHNQYGSFEYSIKRYREVKLDIGWEGKLRLDNATSKSEKYYLFKDDMLGPFNFLDFLNNICHDWDIITNK